MASGYSNAAGVDFDDLFQPGTVAAPQFERSNGMALQYAARGSVAKIPNVGYQDSSGTDLSELWLPAGAAPPVPGFDGASYSALAVALPGPGNTTATLLLRMSNDGTWDVTRTLAGTDNSGDTTLASGTWLPAGGSVSDYAVRFDVSAGTGLGVVSNGAPTNASLSTTRTVSLAVSVPSSSLDDKQDTRTVTATLLRTGAGASAATCQLSCTATFV